MGLCRRGKIFWVRLTRNGKRIQISTETSNKKLAEDIYGEILTEIQENKWFENRGGKKHTFDEMMEKYIKEHSKVHKAESTYKKDLSMLSHLHSVFSGLTLNKITRPIIADYKTKRSSEGASPASIRNELRLLGHAFNVAIKQWEWGKENPVSKVSFRELKARSIDRWLRAEEEEKLLNASEGKLDGQLKDIIILAMNTGMSQEEVLKLQGTNIDFSRRTITTRRKKTQTTRTIPINSTVQNLLNRRLKVKSINRSSYVFFNRAGNMIDTGKLKRVFKKTVDASGIDHFRFHDLRHTFATRLAQAGVDLYKTSKLLGHKDISTTQRYAHHYPESLRSSVEVLDSGTILVQSGEIEKGYVT